MISASVFRTRLHTGTSVAVAIVGTITITGTATGNFVATGCSKARASDGEEKEKAEKAEAAVAAAAAEVEGTKVMALRTTTAMVLDMGSSMALMVTCDQGAPLALLTTTNFLQQIVQFGPIAFRHLRLTIPAPLPLHLVLHQAHLEV